MSGYVEHKEWNRWRAFPCSDRDAAYIVEAGCLATYMPPLNQQGPRNSAGASR